MEQNKMQQLAEEWAFDINGHKWSNNNNEAGDNYGSFIAGYQAAEKQYAALRAKADRMEQALYEIQRLATAGIFTHIKPESIGAANCIPIEKLAREALEQESEKEPVPQQGPVWVKSSDRKPEHNVGVLVFIPGEDNHITSGMWDISNQWVLLDEYRTPEEEVTHWMLLPAFPEGYPHNEVPDEIAQEIKKIAKEELSKRPTCQLSTGCIDWGTCEKNNGCKGRKGDDWINVKEQLPYRDGDSSVYCLVNDACDGIVVRPYNEAHGCWDQEDGDDYYTDAVGGKITHWMPLPEQPKKEVKS